MKQPWIDAEWVREQLDRSGKTQRALAGALGLDPSGVSRLLEGTRKIKVEEIPVLHAFFGVGDEPAPARAARETGTRGEEPPQPGDEPRRGRSGPKPRSKSAGDLPVYAGLLPDRRLEFEMRDARPAEYRARPPQLVGVSGAYAIFVPDDALSPRYRAGEVAYVHPSKPPVPGTDVVIRLRDTATRLIVGQFVEADGSWLVLRHPGAPARHEHPRDHVRVDADTVAQVGRIVATAAD